MLELGAGPGYDGTFFQEHGLDVAAIDLSPGNVALCRAKGLDARVMDFRRLEFAPESFDAAYSLNSLLHVPNASLPGVLSSVRSVLRVGGLFFLGVYGGESREGPLVDDWLDPPRFFSFRTDDELLGFARPSFEVVDFHVVGTDSLRFQSLTLHRPDDG